MCKAFHQHVCHPLLLPILMLRLRTDILHQIVRMSGELLGRLEGEIGMMDYSLINQVSDLRNRSSPRSPDYPDINKQLVSCNIFLHDQLQNVTGDLLNTIISTATAIEYFDMYSLDMVESWKVLATQVDFLHNGFRSCCYSLSQLRVRLQMQTSVVSLERSM